MALLEVLSIACGFIRQLLEGIYVLDDLTTAWVSSCTSFTPILPGLARRRAELAPRGEDVDRAGGKDFHRPALARQNVPHRDPLLNGAATMRGMGFVPFTVPSDKSPNLVLALPIV